MSGSGVTEMSDALTVEHGREPWLPVSHATPGEIFDRYDVPRAGLLHVRGETYLFDCLVGDGGPTGIWAYAHVHEGQVKALLASHGPEEFEAVASEIFGFGWVTVAIATDHAIIESTVLDAHHDDGKFGLAKRFLKHLEGVTAASNNVRNMVGTMPA